MTRKEELTEIVGADNVFDDPETLEEYSKDSSFVRPLKPRCVVKIQGSDDPDKTHEEIEAVVKWANDTSTPLVPISSGPPRFRGDTVPNVGGAVVVDMTQMNRIIHVDYKEQVALIEPGVTFAQLIPALEKEGMRPFLPLLPRSSKSVIGSYMEKEPILQPRHHWESQDPVLNSMQILGSGDMIKMGSADMYTLQEQWAQKKAQKWFNTTQFNTMKIAQGSQGTIGITCWISMKCALLPEIHELLLIPSDNLEPLIDLSYMALRYRWGEELFLLNDYTLASIMNENGEDIKYLRESLPPWTLLIGIAGFVYLPEERVEVQQADIEELAGRYGLRTSEWIPGVRGEEILETLYGPANGVPYKLRDKGGCEELFFVSTLDKTPGFVSDIFSLASSYRYPNTDIGIYVQPMLQGCCCHCEFDFPFDPEDSRESDRVQKLVAEGSEYLANRGALFSRPYEKWADVAYSHMSAQELTALQKTKHIFDPNNIMNPGKLCF